MIKKLRFDDLFKQIGILTLGMFAVFSLLLTIVLAFKKAVHPSVHFFLWYFRVWFLLVMMKSARHLHDIFIVRCSTPIRESRLMSSGIYASILGILLTVFGFFFFTPFLKSWKIEMSFIAAIGLTVSFFGLLVAFVTAFVLKVKN